jgi:hypothetical protein
MQMPVVGGKRLGINGIVARRMTIRPLQRRQV